MCENVIDNKILEQRQLLKDRGICVIIPTYNNVGTIVDVVTRAKFQCDDVIVVSDGANDGTLELLRNLENIVIVKLENNQGKGSALKHGFKKALELGFSYAITIDADGQHYPEDIPCLLSENIKNPGTIIVGERKNLEKMERSAGSKFANKFSNFWFFVQTGQWLNDTQTGYRLYPIKKIRGLNFLTSRYEAELELLVFASWHGTKIISTPVNVFYPPKEERVSHFKPTLDFTRISILNTILCVLAVVYGLPLNILRTILKLGVSLYSFLFFLLTSLFILTPITMLYVSIGGNDERKQRKIRKLIHLFARFIMVWHGIPRVKFKTNSASDEIEKSPSIIICNHQSHLDLMALLSQIENVVFMTNNWVWNSPLFGYVIQKAGYILASEGVENTEHKIRALIEKGVNVAIFPEGTRSVDCSINRFHSGAFYLAKSLNVQILPAILYGAGKVLPKKGKLFNAGIIEVCFDNRINICELVKEHKTMRGLASYMRKYYQKRYSEISNKIEQNV